MKVPTTNHYTPNPHAPGYWTYAGLHISADLGTHQFAIEHALAHLPVRASVLDIATGEGALAKQFLDLGYCDVSCTSWNGKCQLPIPTYPLNLDCTFSPVEVGARQYDLVCAIEIIEHVENPAAFLRACRSVLAPGGNLILSTPNVESAQARLQWLLRGTPDVFDVSEINTNRHISMLGGPGLQHLIDLTGFTVLKREFVGDFKLNPTIRAISKRLAYQLIHRLCSGDTLGTTRIYVLAHGDTGIRQEGPAQVY